MLLNNGYDIPLVSVSIQVWQSDSLHLVPTEKLCDQQKLTALLRFSFLTAQCRMHQMS